MEKRIGLGLLGCGGVGSAFVGLLHRQAATYRERHGIDFRLIKIAVANLEKPRGAHIAPTLLTDRILDVVDHPEVHTVIEVIGGIGPALEAVKRALNHGKNVVTANKAMLATHGPELMDLAHQNGVQLRFEAAVGGGLPIIGTIMSGLSANTVREVMAIVNGTTNYILTRMSREGMSFEDALRQAQERGFAEADPTADVEGHDAAQKLAIVGALSFGVASPWKSIPTEGISLVTSEDVAAAARFDYRLRLLAIARKHPRGIELRVNPGMVPSGHFLAGIEDEFNAFLIDGDATGEIFLVGRGAGPEPTASAVLADALEVAIRNIGPTTFPTYTWEWGQHTLLADEDMETGYYMRFPVDNRPGLIGKITSVLGAWNINIDMAHARQGDGQPDLGIVEILSQRAREADIRGAFADLEASGVLRGPARRIRIEVWRPEGGYL